MITIGFLANNLDSIPELAAWFRNQWSDFYVDVQQEVIERAFLEEASLNRLPIRLVAFHSNELAGTVVLRERGHVNLQGCQPELGGLFVTEPHRGPGIGTELVREGIKLAYEQGYETVYATTINAAGILERLDWKFVKSITHRDEQLSLYQCHLLK